MYICIVTHIYSKGLHQPGNKVAGPARGQLNRENEYFPVRVLVPENLVSRGGFGSPVPRQSAHLHTVLRLNLMLTYGIPPEFRGGVYLFVYNRHTPASGQSRVYRVKQLLRTDGVHCRESAGTGSVNPKVVPNECCLGRSPWTN